jgi:hypothetical protein
LCNDATKPSHLSWNFFPSTLKTHFTSCLSISCGPIYNLTGTPLSSQWLYFHPGL